MQKALQKFSKTYFHIDDNVIEKKLLAMIKEKPFIDRGQLSYIIEDLRFFFAQSFTNGNMKKARKVMDNTGN